MKSKPLLLVLTVVILALAAFLLLGKVKDAGPKIPAGTAEQVIDSDETPTDKETRSDTMSETDEAAALAEQMRILPESLQDVPRPGQLDVDDNGELVINTKIRTLFDYYLSALGEEDLELIRRRVDYHVSDLPDGARQEAMAIFDNYLTYLSAIDDLNRANSGTVLQGGNVDDVIRMKESVMALRQQYFSPDVALVFFAQDDAWDNYVVERLKVSNDELLSEDEKKAAIQALDALLPPEFVQSKQQSDRLGNYRSLTEYARENPDSNIDLERVRSDSFGTEAANRLSALDRKRSKWNDRVKTYRKDRDQALEFQIPGSEAYQSALEEVRARHFEGGELRRITALDAIESQE